MLNSLAIVFTIFLFGNLSTGFSYAQNRETWYGEYYFSEEPVKANAGYNMVMEWKLAVYPGEGNTLETGGLEGMGQQTDLKFNVYIQGDQNDFLVFFSEALSERNQGLKKGDVLFSLKKTNHGWITTWGAIQPMLSEKPEKTCSDCFVMVE